MRHRPRRPPLGLMPYGLWCEHHPEPSVADLLARYQSVCEAVGRYRQQGARVRVEWLVEMIGDRMAIDALRLTADT
jgi:hypothetical protein